MDRAPPHSGGRTRGMTNAGDLWRRRRSSFHFQTPSQLVRRRAVNEKEPSTRPLDISVRPFGGRPASLLMGSRSAQARSYRWLSAALRYRRPNRTLIGSETSEFLGFFFTLVFHRYERNGGVSALLNVIALDSVFVVLISFLFTT